MNVFDTVNMAGLRDLVTHARQEARDEARMQGQWVRSRGTYLTTADKMGQCDPRPAAECPTWNGTRQEIDDLIALCQEKYPNVCLIMIEGGFDCADTFEELYKSDDYTPQASWWEVVVWEKE